MRDPTIRSIQADTAHRPWPMPGGPWIMFQSWQQLLFAHWRVPVELLRDLVPAELEPEEHDGSGWVGLTPFRLTGLRARFLPALPGISEFPEMNLRTYVRVGDRPGIFFFSLDAGSTLAVIGARAGYRLPYYRAEMRIAPRGEWIHYHSRRRGDPAAELVARYRPTGAELEARPGTLEHFLVERYALYTVLRNGRILRGDIHHRPWRLRSAEAVIERNTVAAAHGFDVAGREPLLHYSERQDTLIWGPKRV